jgi:hypothetical protein
MDHGLAGRELRHRGTRLVENRCGRPAGGQSNLEEIITEMKFDVLPDPAKTIEWSFV